MLAAYRQKPTRKILGTENTQSREAWLALRDNLPYAGQFLWSGIDYLGESPGWPMIAFNLGLLDRTGTPRPLAFQRQSWWSEQPMVHLTRRVAPTPLATLFGKAVTMGEPALQIEQLRAKKSSHNRRRSRGKEQHQGDNSYS